MIMNWAVNQLKACKAGAWSMKMIFGDEEHRRHPVQGVKGRGTKRKKCLDIPLDALILQRI